MLTLNSVTTVTPLISILGESAASEEATLTDQLSRDEMETEKMEGGKDSPAAVASSGGEKKKKRLCSDVIG